MSDRVAVMCDGRLAQVAIPRDVYEAAEMRAVQGGLLLCSSVQGELDMRLCELRDEHELVDEREGRVAADPAPRRLACVLVVLNGRARAIHANGRKVVMGSEALTSTSSIARIAD